MQQDQRGGQQALGRNQTPPVSEPNSNPTAPGSSSSSANPSQQRASSARARQPSVAAVNGGRTCGGRGLSNATPVRLALTKVCLAGVPSRDQRVQALAALEAEGDKAFVILFGSKTTQRFHGLYVHQSVETAPQHLELRRIFGRGPQTIR